MVPLNGRRISPIPRIRDRPRSLPPVGGHDLRVDWQLSLQQVFGDAAVQGLTVRRKGRRRWILFCPRFRRTDARLVKSVAYICKQSRRRLRRFFRTWAPRRMSSTPLFAAFRQRFSFSLSFALSGRNKSIGRTCLLTVFWPASVPSLSVDSSSPVGASAALYRHKEAVLPSSRQRSSGPPP